MNAIVVVALKRPYTFVVLAILILLFGGRAAITTPTDIFPNIGIPVIAVVWTYNGLTPADMSGRVIYYYERSVTTEVNGIEHMESNSLYGRGIVKIFFQPGTDIAVAQAQIAAVSQTVLKQMPPGITPPEILVYNASSVPVLDLQIGGQGMTVQQLENIASNFIRPALISVPGVAIPQPYGGTSRTVEIDLNQHALLEHGLSAQDVLHALDRQNLVLPAGDQKIAKLDYLVATNAQPIEISTFNNLPIKQVGNAVVYMHDVAFVHGGGPPETNMVLLEGQQAILLQVIKTGNVSTLAVVAGVKKMIPDLLKTVPKGVTITPLNDASKFVRASIVEVVREMVIAAALTGMMVLLFLGSWRSTLIVATSIPLAILSSILGLSLIGESINVMTLGGLALAVGILVDDATVMIENISSHLEEGQELEQAIIDAANQIVVATFVSTLCICIVFTPMFTLTGVAGFLFQPLAEAIVLAMIASFILSRTLVPTMAAYLLRAQVRKQQRAKDGKAGRPGIFAKFHESFDRSFSRFRDGYRDLLEEIVAVRVRFIVGFLAAVLSSLLLITFLGRDFFPELNSGSMAMHMRARIGTRIEDAGKLAVLTGHAIRHLLPGQVKSIVDNCGLPVSGINEAYSESGTIGPQDCDITIDLKNSESPVAHYRDILRAKLPELFPGTIFSFPPGDITSQILNFGLPAPIDVQIIGHDEEANYEYAKRLLRKLSRIPGIADPLIQQSYGAPTLRIDAHRSFATETGLDERDIAYNALTTLSGSGQVQPNFWLDNSNGVSYLINIQTPQSDMDTMGQLETIPIDSDNPNNRGVQILGALASFRQTGSPLLVSHYNIAPVIDIFANRQVRDLGGVYSDVQKAVRETAGEVPYSAHVRIRGQATTMYSAYSQLLLGLLTAVILVYLIIVVNFQSWLDPFIIITALPAAVAGIVWSLFITHTSVSVPALTGAIMCMGTATANSILVVAFARQRLAAHGDATRAAVEAGYARIRPVLMTALAMVIGMLPMSLSNTTNAPLGRAVMGGLTLATFATLLFVPAVFALVHGGRRGSEASGRGSDGGHGASHGRARPLGAPV
jgi:multidrug efflux pump subunit AcrB